MNNAGTVNIADNSLLTIVGTNTNTGAINLQSGGNSTDLAISGAVSLNGSGSVTLSNTNANRVYAAGASTLTLGTGQTLQGAGQLGASSALAITNNGTVIANQTNALTLNSAGSVINNNVMRADGAGTSLTITSTAVTQGASGTLNAINNGTVSLTGGTTITGGSFSTASGGQVAVASGTVSIGGVTNTGTFNIRDNTALNLNGTLTNNGVVNMQSAGNSTDFVIAGTQTINGTGTINLSNTSANRIYSNVASTLTLGSGQTLSGSGQIGVTAVFSLNNAGTIIATQSNPLLVNAGAGVTNTGTLRADGGTLQLQTTINSAGGSIEARNGSLVQLMGGAVINNANFSATGVGSLIATQSGTTVTLGGGTVNGPMTVTDNSALKLTGDVTYNGVLTVASAGNSTDLVLSGARTISGAATIQLSNTTANRIYGATAADSLTIANGVTIRGSGQLGAGTAAAIANNGTVIANQTNALTLNSAGSVTNNNVMRADGAGTSLTIASTAVTQGASGTLNAINNGTVSLTGGTTITGGSFSTASGGQVAVASGTVSIGGVTNTGTFNIRDNTALNLNGTLTNNGVVNMQSAGNSTDFVIAGTQTINGTGTINLSNTGANRIYAAVAGNGLTLGSGQTLQGAGQIGVGGQFNFTNNGTIIGNVSSGLAFSSTGTVTNNNIVRADGGPVVITATSFGQSGSGVVNAINSGIVSLTGNATVTGGSFTTASGGQIRTVGGNAANIANVTNSGTFNVVDNSTLRLAGTIANDGAINMNSAGNSTDLRVVGNVTLGGSGTTTLSNTNANRIVANTSADQLTVGAAQTLQGSGQLGGGSVLNIFNQGTIVANQSSALNVQIGLGASFQNQTGGAVRAANGATLSVLGGTTFTNNVGGVVQALANSTVVFQNGAVVTNLVGNTLSGGIWQANSTGGGAGAITFQTANTNINVNQADIYLIGANSVIQGLDSLSVNKTLDQTLSSNLGSLRIQAGRVFNATANSGNFINGSGALLELSDGTFQSNNLTLANNASNITSFGTSALTTNNQINGNGQINVANGTLTIAKGFNLAAGSAASVASGATLSLAGATAASTVGTVTTSGNIALGSQNLNVTKDYTNTNFGSGNAFNARANVTGTGNIVGVNANQTITGGVTAAGANTWTLNLGNVRGGSATTVNYQVANNGTGADIRGAVQTGAPGLGNITDTRLSGTGATAGNFGPIAVAANSGNKAVTFTATSGGSLAGQSIAMVSNFSNVATQVINLNGMASALAVGSATPNANPVNLNNFRVGGTQPTQGFAVANTTSGAGSERLGIGSVGTTGNFAATNNLGAGFVNGGASQPNAVTAAVSGGVAGVNTGSTTIQYTTNGALIDPTFTSINANAQTINLQAKGYVAASGAIQPPTSFSFGTLQVGQSVSQNLVIRNTAIGPSGFVEDLNAVFGASGNSQITGSGGLNGILSGSNSTGANGAMTVTVTGMTAGALNSNIGVDYFTSGKVNGVSNGLVAAPVGSDSYGVNGTITTSANVINQASPQINNSPINLGNVRLGTASPTGLVSVTNVATAAPQAALNASIGGATAGLTASGSFNLLNPGLTNSSSLQVGLNTAAAGSKNGTATLSFVSDANNVGNCAPNCQLTLASQTVAVNGAVYREAAVATTTLTPSITLAARVGGAASNTISVTNTSVDGFTEGLNVVRGATAAGFTSSGGPITNLAANASSIAIGVALNTTTAGVFSGNQVLALASSGTITNNITEVMLGNVNVALAGKVYSTAVALVNTASPINFSIVHVGDVVPQKTVSVTNNTGATALGDSLVGSISATGPFIGSGTLGAGVAANATNATSLKVGLNTSTAGVFSGGIASLALASHNPDMADQSLGITTVGLTAQVNNYANLNTIKISGGGSFTRVGNVFTLDFGNVLVGSGQLTAGLRILNDVAGPADAADGSYCLAGAACSADAFQDFTSIGFGAFTDVGAGATANNVTVSHGTAGVGLFEDDIVLIGALGHNLSGYSGALADLRLHIRANVINQGNSVPEPGSLYLLLLAAAGAVLARRRQAVVVQ